MNILSQRPLTFRTVFLHIGLFFGVLLALAFPLSGSAAVVKTVQIGTATVSGTTLNVPITAVTDDKSILIFNLTTHSTTSGPQDTHLRGQLSCSSGSCNSISFKRYGSNDNISVRWQVLEFTTASAVTVKRGITTQSSMSGTPPNITLSTGVNSSQSFVLLSEFVHGSVTSDDDFTRGQINTSGNLVLTVGEKKTSPSSAEIAWQVIEYQDANIQKGDVTFNTNNTVKNIPISGIDEDKTLLVYNYYSTGKSYDNPVCQNLISGQINNTSTLRFNRGCGNHNGEIHLTWFVIEFTDATTVQHGLAQFNASETSKTISLTNAVDTSCAITTTGYHQRGGKSSATGDHVSSAWFNAGLNTAGDEITLARGQSNGVAAETGWFAIEFEGCGSTPPVTPTPRPYVPQSACGIEGFSETFGAGVGRSPFPNSATTTYTYNDGSNADPLLNYVQDGQYAILDKSSIAAAGYWWIVDDDATGDTNGRMLMINANHTSGEYYRQAVSNLTIGKTYSFDAYIANPYSNGDAQDPNVKFSVEAGGIEVASVVTGDIPEDPGVNDINWNKFTLVFTATATEVDIVLKDEAPISGVMTGNDVVFDGISLAETCLDYSDAPSSYSTPSHIIDSSIYLGSAAPDAEDAATPGSSATGDDTAGTDDEDGITLPSLTQGQTATITISTEAPSIIGMGSGSKPAIIASEGYLQGWIDWNGDGDFNDASEQIISNLQDGSASDTDGAVNKQISVDITVPATATTTQTYARFRWSRQNGLDATSRANDGEVEDYELTILSSASCTALSGNTNANIAPALQLRNGDKLYLASNTTADKEGHLKAFAFDSNGTPSTTVSWDAALQMDAAERGLELFSTNASGNIVTLNTLDEAAFETNGIPDVATIRAYTLNPAHSSGLYLNGRRDGAFLGTISPNSNLGLLDNTIDVMAYLDDTHYRTHYENVISKRSAESSAAKPKRVFLSSDDGFLYAFDQYDGDLGWGWMPRSLVKELKDHATFQDNHFMQGHIDVLELKNTSNNSYASYIIGSYRDGLGQYVLRLDASGDLDAVVWDADYLTQASVMNQAPNHGKRAYFSNNSGSVFSTFVTTNINDESTLHIRSLTDDTNNITVPLNFKATSTPFVSIDLASSNAPAAKTLYVGSSAADIFAVSLFATDGTLKTGSQIGQSIAKVASLGNGSTSAVTYLGISSSLDTANYYLRAQSEDQLTLFSYDASDSSWDKKWTTYVSGAGKWLSPTATTLTADSDIDSLPADSIITDEARIVAGSVVLPVMHTPSGTNCYGDAYYYFYKLDNGHFPTDRFFTSNNSTPIADKLNLGVGSVRTLHLTDLSGKQKQLGIGIADQTNANNSGINTSFYIKDAISTGIRSWREIR